MIELRDSTVVIMNGAERVELYNGNNKVANFNNAANFQGTIALFNRIQLGVDDNSDGELYQQDPVTNIILDNQYQVIFKAPGIGEEYFIYYRKNDTKDDLHPVRFIQIGG